MSREGLEPSVNMRLQGGEGRSVRDRPPPVTQVSDLEISRVDGSTKDRHLRKLLFFGHEQVFAV